MTLYQIKIFFRQEGHELIIDWNLWEIVSKEKKIVPHMPYDPRFQESFEPFVINTIQTALLLILAFLWL